MLTWVTAGTVQDRQEDPDYMGGPGHTNNTGDLSAMAYALRRALTRKTRETARAYTQTHSLREKHDDRPVDAQTTAPKHPPNIEPISNLRRLWRRTQTRMPGTVDHAVDIVHVRSHIEIPGNEIADWLQ